MTWLEAQFREGKEEEDAKEARRRREEEVSLSMQELVEVLREQLVTVNGDWEREVELGPAGAAPEILQAPAGPCPAVSIITTTSKYQLDLGRKKRAREHVLGGPRAKHTSGVLMGTVSCGPRCHKPSPVRHRAPTGAT